MIDLFSDPRTVMTLDAGGTNFVFSAIRGGEEIIEPVRYPSNANDLNICLQSIFAGFDEVYKKLPSKPHAISFAFPGPADYPAGIIGDLGNLPCFRGGIPLGPMLREHFNIPVYINNDGDLFAYGEAIAGFLPLVNKKLREAGSSKQYRNLFGVTLGTGFGGGIVHNGELFIGDNAAGAEIWLMRHKNGQTFVEEGASIRGIRREYALLAAIPFDDSPEPKDIYLIAKGEKEGNQKAAVTAFEKFGQVVGDALANAITLIDGLIVIGGGLAGASEFFLPALVNEMNAPFASLGGKPVNRLEMQVFNLEDEKEFAIFATGKETEIYLPGNQHKLKYDPMKRTGVGLSVLGTSRAISLGAYAFALFRMDKTK